jgi:hypothetical protein
MIEVLMKSFSPVNTAGHEPLSLLSAELKKVKLNKKGGLDVLVEASVMNPDSEDPYRIVIPVESGIPVHPDLHSVLRRMAAHLALIDERVEYSSENDALRLQMDEGVKASVWPLNQYHVRGVILKGIEGEDSEGVQINGMKTLKTGKPINILTPFVSLTESKTDYAHMISLADAVADLRLEVRNYFGGKVMPPSQLAMGFDDVEEIEE